MYYKLLANWFKSWVTFSDIEIQSAEIHGAKKIDTFEVIIQGISIVIYEYVAIRLRIKARSKVQLLRGRFLQYLFSTLTA